MQLNYAGKQEIIQMIVIVNFVIIILNVADTIEMMINYRDILD